VIQYSAGMGSALDNLSVRGTTKIIKFLLESVHKKEWMVRFERTLSRKERNNRKDSSPT
jgi:hypothetical protein